MTESRGLHQGGRFETPPWGSSESERKDHVSSRRPFDHPRGAWLTDCSVGNVAGGCNWKLMEGKEQASGLSKEQVAPSGPAGGPPWHLSPLFDAEACDLMRSDQRLPICSPRFRIPCVRKRNAKAPQCGRIVLDS